MGNNQFPDHLGFAFDDPPPGLNRVHNFEFIPMEDFDHFKLAGLEVLQAFVDIGIEEIPTDKPTE